MMNVKFRKVSKSAPNLLFIFICFKETNLDVLCDNTKSELSTSF